MHIRSKYCLSTVYHFHFSRVYSAKTLENYCSTCAQLHPRNSSQCLKVDKLHSYRIVWVSWKKDIRNLLETQLANTEKREHEKKGKLFESFQFSVSARLEREKILVWCAFSLVRPYDIKLEPHFPCLLNIVPAPDCWLWVEESMRNSLPNAN